MKIPTFNKTITLINRYVENKQEKYRKTIIKNCFYSVKNARNTIKTDINNNNAYIVRMLWDNEYLPFNEWKNNLQGFTISLGDFIFLGELQEEVENSNIIHLVNANKPNVFKITFFKVNDELPFKHFHIEGV